jgi:hypothetical protein
MREEIEEEDEEEDREEVWEEIQRARPPPKCEFTITTIFFFTILNSPHDPLPPNIHFCCCWLSSSHSQQALAAVDPLQHRRRRAAAIIIISSPLFFILCRRRPLGRSTSSIIVVDQPANLPLKLILRFSSRLLCDDVFLIFALLFSLSLHHRAAAARLCVQLNS